MSDPVGGFRGECFVLAGFMGIDGGVSDEPRRSALLVGSPRRILGGLVGDCCTCCGWRRPPQILSVGDVQVTADASGGHTFLFSVKNVGTSYIDGYGVNFEIISQ